MEPWLEIKLVELIVKIAYLVNKSDLSAHAKTDVSIFLQLEYNLEWNFDSKDKELPYGVCDIFVTFSTNNKRVV